MKTVSLLVLTVAIWATAFRSALERFLLPDISICARCGRPYIFPAMGGNGTEAHPFHQLNHDQFFGYVGVRMHGVDFKLPNPDVSSAFVITGMGMFAICEGCWSKCSTEQRVLGLIAYGNSHAGGISV